MKSVIASFLVVLVSALSLVSFSAGAQGLPPEFYSPTSQEAVLQFEFYVYLKSGVQPSARVSKRQVEKQIAFLFGTLSNREEKSVPKGDHELAITSIVMDRNLGWKISYNYRGVIQTSVSQDYVRFELPLNPDEIFGRGLVPSAPQGMRIPCGDSTHPEPEYFWYFFNPHAYGCPLQAGTDYQQLDGNLQFLPSTGTTYPEYQRLVNEKVINAHLFFGMNDPSLSRNPVSSRDIGASAYRSLRQNLIQKGYQVHTWTAAEFEKYFDGQSFLYPFVEDFSKAAPSGVTMKVRLFFGPTDTYSAQGFFKFYQQALLQSSLLVYAGHSGLGEYLDLATLHGQSGLQFSMPKDRYQILFFNGCSSYPYYNQQYLGLKFSPQDPRGTKNLDIITNGLATLFLAITPSTTAIFSAVENWVFSGRRMSYQDMLRTADSSNLMAVNGDEDNP